MKLNGKFGEYLSRKLDKDRLSQLFPHDFQFEQSSDPYSSSKKSTISIASSNFNQYDFNSSEQKSNGGYQQHNHTNSQPIQFKRNRNTSSPSPSLQHNTSNKNAKLTRLKKGINVKQIYANECSICLQTIQEHTRTELKCGHQYCLQCLEQWLLSSSNCPYCRTPAEYYLHNGVKYPIIQKEYEHEEEEMDQIDWICYLCDVTHEGDIVIICDRCQAHACHIQCDPDLNGVQPPEDQQWICHYCRQ